MIKFFRKIRKQLITEKKFRNYVVYAVGEIILIVIGILIALSLNNQNTKNDKRESFEIALNQINTNLYCEYGWHEYVLEGLKKQKEIVEEELNNSTDSLRGSEIPNRLVYLRSGYLDYKTSSPHLLLQLQQNITSKRQNILVNQINNHYSIFEEWWNDQRNIQVNYFSELFKKYNFSYHSGIDLYNEDAALGARNYTREDIIKAEKIREDPEYRSALLSTRNKINELIFSVSYRLSETEALLEYFDNADISPELNFNRLGLIGSATPHGWDKSIPMELIDADKQVWKIKTQLDNGKIKFRNGNSWNQNWGGTDAFNGEVLFFGRHIPVTKGYYEIELNIVDKKYNIRKVGAVQ